MQRMCSASPEEEYETSPFETRLTWHTRDGTAYTTDCAVTVLRSEDDHVDDGISGLLVRTVAATPLTCPPPSLLRADSQSNSPVAQHAVLCALADAEDVAASAGHDSSPLQQLAFSAIDRYGVDHGDVDSWARDLANPLCDDAHNDDSLERPRGPPRLRRGDAAPPPPRLRKGGPRPTQPGDASLDGDITRLNLDADWDDDFPIANPQRA